MRGATEAKSTKTQLLEKIVPSWQRAAQNDRKHVKNIFSTCLDLEEFVLKNLATARTKACIQEFPMFARDLERPKCNFGGNRPFLAENYPSSA